MNIRDLPSITRTGSRDMLPPAIIRLSAFIGVEVYRGLRGCGNYRPDPDAESPAPCLNCGRPASEHGDGR